MWEAIIGMAMQMFGNEVNKADQQAQYDQQAKLGMQQAVYQQQLGRFNQELAMKTWNQTGYAAQVEQLKQAGLNPGLVYKGAGQGGTVLGNQAGNSVAGGMAAPGQKLQAMGLALNAAMQTAQIKNIEANTKKTEVETQKTAGVDTAQTAATTEQAITATEKLKAETEKIKAETNNTELQSALITAQTDVAKIEANVKNLTQKELIEQIQITNDKLYGEAQSALTKANVDKSTRIQTIQLIEQSTVEQQLRIASQKADIKLTNQQITKIAQEVNVMIQNNMREWDKMTQTDKEIRIKNAVMEIMKQQTDFNTSGAAQIKQMTSIVTDIMQTMR